MGKNRLGTIETIVALNVAGFYIPGYKTNRLRYALLFFISLCLSREMIASDGKTRDLAGRFEVKRNGRFRSRSGSR